MIGIGVMFISFTALYYTKEKVLEKDLDFVERVVLLFFHHNFFIRIC